VLVVENGRTVATNKAQWLKIVGQQFSLENRSSRSEGVWIDRDYSNIKNNEDPFRVLILERVDQNHGDCCVYHRFDVLTLDENKIAKIEISMSFSTQLQTDGGL
jgi:hypothetical protein